MIVRTFEHFAHFLAQHYAELEQHHGVQSSYRMSHCVSKLHYVKLRHTEIANIFRIIGVSTFVTVSHPTPSLLMRGVWHLDSQYATMPNNLIYIGIYMVLCKSERPLILNSHGLGFIFVLFRSICQLDAREPQCSVQASHATSSLPRNPSYTILPRTRRHVHRRQRAVE